MKNKTITTEYLGYKILVSAGPKDGFIALVQGAEFTSDSLFNVMRKARSHIRQLAVKGKGL